MMMFMSCMSLALVLVVTRSRDPAETRMNTFGFLLKSLSKCLYMCTIPSLTSPYNQFDTPNPYKRSYGQDEIFQEQDRSQLSSFHVKGGTAYRDRPDR
jgi:hypothetical protein